MNFGGTPPPGRVTRFYSGDGRYGYNVQSDQTPEYPHGKIVQYDTHGTTDETQWAAVGLIRPETLG